MKKEYPFASMNPIQKWDYMGWAKIILIANNNPFTEKELSS